MENNDFAKITRRYSTSFYFASLMFPKDIRKDVYALYSFLRYSDELSDTVRDKEKFTKFRQLVIKSLESHVPTGDMLTDTFTNLYQKYKFEKKWVVSFFDSLETDMADKVQITTYKELEKYIYGVADVVGLMMMRIMKAPDMAAGYGRMLGRAMQLINIIRDVKEDYGMGRLYLPKEDIDRIGLRHISPDGSNFDRKKFEELIRYELERALDLLGEAEKGYKYIPAKVRKPVVTAGRLYTGLASKIYRQPIRIWEGKIKLNRVEFFWVYIKSLLYVV